MAELLGKSAAPVGFAGQHYALINDDIYDGLIQEQAKAPATAPGVGLDVRDPVFRRQEGLVW